MKTQRQAKIMEIISTKNVETQEQLLQELQAQGFTGTQATISRDIKHLHLVKVLTPGGVYKYALSPHKASAGVAGRLRTIFRESATSCDVAQNIVVIKTMPGLANAAAAAIDGMDLPDVVGSLAGDDTAFLVMRDTESAAEFCEEIKEML